MDKTLLFYDDNAAEMTRRYEEIDFDEPIDTLASHLSPGDRILEIGSGSGRDAARLTGLGYEVTGIEGSAAMIEEAKKLHPELSDKLIHHILPSALPFPDERFDAIMSWAVLMHLRQADLGVMFAEISRVTEPEGLFVYSVNTKRGGLDAEDNDGRREGRLACGRLVADGVDRSRGSKKPVARLVHRMPGKGAQQRPNRPAHGKPGGTADHLSHHAHRCDRPVCAGKEPDIMRNDIRSSTSREALAASFSGHNLLLATEVRFMVLRSGLFGYHQGQFCESSGECRLKPFDRAVDT